jgi:hypothetical protein
MPLKDFPTNSRRIKKPAIDYVMADRSVLTESETKDITSAGIDKTISRESPWQINSVAFKFSNAAAKDYSLQLIEGRKIVQYINDSLWFQHANSLWQRIVIAPGFYTGDDLATEIQNKLDANTEFDDLGITFTVTYSDSDGTFEITPSSGTIRYIDLKNAAMLSTCLSTAGHVIGLNATTAFAANVVSDTPVFGLNSSSFIITESSSTETSDYSNDIHILSVDQAVKATTGTANSMSATFTVTFEDLV